MHSRSLKREETQSAEAVCKRDYNGVCGEVAGVVERLVYAAFRVVAAVCPDLDGERAAVGRLRDVNV